MSENQKIVDQLREMLSWKKSKKFYAEKLGVTEQKVEEILSELKQVKKDIIDVKSQMITLNLDSEIKTLEELVIKGNIDTSIWNIDKFIQNYWGNREHPYWQVKAYLSRKEEKDIQKVDFQKNFIDFIKNYDRKAYRIDKHGFDHVGSKPPVAVVINKQDEHVNKYDISGQNDLTARMARVYTRMHLILEQVRVANFIDKIFYIVGSDEFNSEWTGATTKGTKQENLVPYQEGFARICNYEVDCINLLRSYGHDIEVIYVPGNHDEYVGWHLITWLKAYFREDEHMKFDTRWEDYTKLIVYGKSAMMLNHGDAIKPEKLASMFPVQFRSEWSKYENYYIFTGDKHHEVSKDFLGIKFYQLPALSKSKSSWDLKQGHTCSKAELTAFVIDESCGMTGILKRPI